MPALPASNQAVGKKVSRGRSANLTPQESEQLSHYVSDEKFVRTQKEDIQELSSLFRSKMDRDISVKGSADLGQTFEEHFHPVAGLHSRYRIVFSDKSGTPSMLLSVDNKELKIPQADDGAPVDVELTLDRNSLNEIISGRMTFQRAFMEGNLKMKGDFKLLRNMDQLFEFK